MAVVPCGEPADPRGYVSVKELAHLETAYSPPVSHILDIMAELANNVWLENNMR